MQSKIIAWLLCFSLVFGDLAPVLAAEGDAPVATADSLEDSTATQSPDAVIAKGFLLKLECPQDARLRGDFRVQSDGRVHLPYDVTMSVSGLSLKVLKNRLLAAYKSYFKGTLDLRVSIKQKRYWVDVLGFVRKPGPQLLRPRASIGEALAQADVRTEDLPTGYVRIDQNGRTSWIKLEDYFKGQGRQEIAWVGGERITFQPEAPSDEKGSGAEEIATTRDIQVVGEVRNPGDVSFQRQKDGYYYLLQRGGPTQFSDLNNVELLRRDKKSGEHKRVAMGDLSALRGIQESDVLIVHSSRPSRFERTLQNSAVVASILSSVVLVTAFFMRR